MQDRDRDRLFKVVVLGGAALVGASTLALVACGKRAAHDDAAPIHEGPPPPMDAGVEPVREGPPPPPPPDAATAAIDAAAPPRDAAPPPDAAPTRRRPHREGPPPPRKRDIIREGPVE